MSPSEPDLVSAPNNHRLLARHRGGGRRPERRDDGNQQQGRRLAHRRIRDLYLRAEVDASSDLQFSHPSAAVHGQSRFTGRTEGAAKDHHPRPDHQARLE